MVEVLVLVLLLVLVLQHQHVVVLVLLLRLCIQLISTWLCLCIWLSSLPIPPHRFHGTTACCSFTRKAQASLRSATDVAPP